MRTWMVFAWVVGALLLAPAQETVLNDDALQKPITVWQRLASLAEVLQDICTQTGVPLRCQDALRETKLTVYVQGYPAREILEQIASLFGLRWRRDDDGGYVLYLPDETRRALERALRDDCAATARALREMLRIAREWLRLPPDARAEAMAPFAQTREYPADVPYSVYLMEQAAAERRMTQEQRVKALTADYLSAYSPQGEPPKPKRDSFFSEEDTGGSLLHCLSEAGDAVVDRLLAGDTLGFSTRSTPDALPLPPRVLLPFWTRRTQLGAEGMLQLEAESGKIHRGASASKSRLGRLLGAPVGVGRRAGVQGRCIERLRTGREDSEVFEQGRQSVAAAASGVSCRVGDLASVGGVGNPDGGVAGAAQGAHAP
jgi:hypothetical protein